MIAEGERPFALVVEDDTVLDWGFLKNLLEVDFEGQGLDYVKLFNKRPVKFKIVQEPFLDRCLVRFTGYAFGTQAYVLTRKGAQTLLQKLQKVRRPVDTDMDRDWYTGLPNLALFPAPGFEAVGQSTIGSARGHAYEIPKELRFRRFKARAKEKIARWIYA